MSTSASMQLDVGDAFGYVFRSRNWFGRLAIGSVCLLFFWLLFVPLFILLGYFVEAARSISRGARELPAWDNVGKKLSEGFVLAVILFIWGLPGSILSWGGGAVPPIHCVAPNCTYQPSALGGIGNLYGLLLGLLTPAIWSQFVEGGFSAAFDFRVVFRRATSQPGLTVMVWLMAIVAAIVGALGVILIVVGLLFTLPYAFAVIANLYGQFARATAPSVAAPISPPPTPS